LQNEASTFGFVLAVAGLPEWPLTWRGGRAERPIGIVAGSQCLRGTNPFFSRANAGNYQPVSSFSERMRAKTTGARGVE
jgi:hypothetical protein